MRIKGGADFGHSLTQISVPLLLHFHHYSPLQNFKCPSSTSDSDEYGGDHDDEHGRDPDSDGRDDDGELQGLPGLRGQGGDQEEGDEGRVEEGRHVLQVLFMIMMQLGGLHGGKGFCF